MNSSDPDVTKYSLCTEDMMLLKYLTTSEP